MGQINDILVLIIISLFRSLSEWLPISTAGHLILLEDIFTIDINSTFYTALSMVTQLGGLAAVILLYFNRLNPLSRKKLPADKKNTWFLWLKIIFASLPTVVITLAFNEPIRRILYQPIPIAIMIIIYSVLLIGMDNKSHGKHAKRLESFGDISFSAAFKIGFFQLFSIIPGISRPATVMIAGLFQGANRKLVADFSVLITLPTFIFLNLSRSFTLPWEVIGEEWINLLLVFSVSFFVSIISIQFLVNYLKTRNFSLFTAYSVILVIGILVYYFLF